MRGRPVGAAGMLKIGLHDADHGERLAVQQDLAPHHAAIGVEAALPQRVAQDDHLMVALDFVRCLEVAAHLRQCAQHVEVIFGNAQYGQPLRAARIGKRQVVLGEDGHALEHTLPLAIVHEIGRVHGELRELRAVIKDPVEAAGVRVGKRIEQHAAHHAEHGAVGADADSQCQHGDQRESRVFQKVAQRVAKVLQ